MEHPTDCQNEPAFAEREAPSGSARQHDESSAESKDSTAGDPTSYFAGQQPKHVLDGLTDGIRNFTTGVVLGAACFVASPIAGMQREGYAGAAKGVLSGAAGLLGMTAIGAVTAVRQVARGVVNTKSALESFSEGKVWNEPTREWLEIRLGHMADHVPCTDDDLLQQAVLSSMAAHASSSQGQEEKSDTELHPSSLYDKLGVSRSATASEIKKAYVALALKLHPDKNTHDPNATKKFQELSDAYRVLSNPVARAEYDQSGKQTEGSSSDKLFEAMESQLGCAAFAPFVGKLKWVVMMASPMRQQIVELQRRRLIRVAAELARTLDDPDVDETGRPAFTRVHQLMPEMLGSKLGFPLVRVIGAAYSDAARQFGEHLAVGLCDNIVADTVSTIGGYANTAVHAAATAYRAAVKKQPVADDDMVELVRRISKNDVYDTVSKACEYACKDQTVDLQARQRRIQRLAYLGHLFVAAAEAAESPTVPALQQANAMS